MTSLLAVVFLMISLFSMSSCGSMGTTQPVRDVDVARVKEELAGRSFRQCEPHVDANPRRGVIIDFMDGLRLWAQYAQDGHALNEWEIAAGGYWVEKHGDGWGITVYFEEPKTAQLLPSPCEGCIRTSGVSISIRDIFDNERIAFRVNDPDGVLPIPFPVFESWTEFREDEYFD